MRKLGMYLTQRTTGRVAASKEAADSSAAPIPAVGLVQTVDEVKRPITSCGATWYRMAFPAPSRANGTPVAHNTVKRELFFCKTEKVSCPSTTLSVPGLRPAFY